MNKFAYSVLYHLSRLKAVLSGLYYMDEYQYLGSAGHGFYEFVDPNDPYRRIHHVIAFILLPGESLDTHYRKDLLGPFGFEFQLPILFGKHLYGLDAWGALSKRDLENAEFVKLNPELTTLIRTHPDRQIQLAGVRRRPDETLPEELSDPKKYMLVRK